MAILSTKRSTRGPNPADKGMSLSSRVPHCRTRHLAPAVAIGVLLLLVLAAPGVGQATNQPPQCPADPTLSVGSGQPLVLPGSPCRIPKASPSR